MFCKEKFCKLKSVFFFAVFLICSALYAHGGKMIGEKDIRIVKTQWFDIIYPQRCEVTASLFYERADEIYNQVTAEYGLTPKFRLPLVIVPGVEVFNAFWTAMPYNHIVMYDTGLSGSSELAVFSETMLSVFRHELTHAVTYNMKNGFFYALDKVFGDCVSPGMLTVTTGMAEGATVSYESSMGEGRLNDEYAKHYVKQAKIEKKFPSYHDVSGSFDVSPSGAAYFFNGAFHGWLQEKYGLKAYAEFWYRVVNLKNLTVSGAFKKSFGIKLKQAWKEFVESYEIPDVAADPEKAGIVSKLIESENNLYACLSTGGNKLVWADRYGGRVFYAEISSEADISNTLKKKCLFALDNITNVTVSADGRFVTASYFSPNAIFDTSRIKIYDFENKSMYSVKEKSIKEAAVIPSGGDYYLVGQKYFNSRYSVSVSKIILNDNNRIDTVEHLFDLPQEAEVNPYSFTTLKDGTFAFLEKDRMNYSVCVYDFTGNKVSEYKFPEERKIAVRSLNGEYFSYTEPGTMPRLGKLDIESGTFYLGKTDISGGIFTPVKYGDTAAYIGKFYRKNNIFVLNQNEEFETLAAGISGSSEKSEADIQAAQIEQSALSALSDTALPSKKYNPLPYLAHGILIPVGSYESNYFGKNAGYSLAANVFPFGLTYMTGAPWTDGSNCSYQVTGGWNILSNSFGAAASITSGTDSSLFQYNLNVKSEFDVKGWKQSGASLQTTFNFQLGNISNVSLSNTAAGYLGRQDARLKELSMADPYLFFIPGYIGKAFSNDDTVYYELIDTVQLQYSNITKVGGGRYEYAGFALSGSISGRYDASLIEPDKAYMNDVKFSSGIKIKLPKLLPFESKAGFTYNLPVTIDYILFPSASIYGYACGDSYYGVPFFDGRVETVLFGMDIQKAVPYFEIVYLTDIYISGGYACTGDAGKAAKGGTQLGNIGSYFQALSNGKGYYYDSVYLKAGFEFVPNVGTFAKSAFKMGLYAGASFVLNGPYNKPLQLPNRFNFFWGFEGLF